MPGPVLGMNCKLYRNTGSYGSPTWSLVATVRDVTPTIEAAEADMTTRANGGWEAILPSLRKITIETEIPHKTTDTNYAALQAAFVAGSVVELLFLDGLIATSGSTGIRASYGITKWASAETLVDGKKTAITFRGAYSDNPPAVYTV